MAEVTLQKTRIREGVWEGVLTGAATTPDLAAFHLQQEVPGLAVAAVPDRPGDWMVRVPIPVSALSEGVQTFLIRDRVTGTTLAHFTLLTGVEMEEDIRAEVDLLRAELDMLKRAFRRHCLETMG